MPSPGPKILSLGVPGTGKTHSLRTLIPAGVKPFVLFTEQSMETLGDLAPSDCHWHYVRSRPGGFESLSTFAERINKLSLDALAKFSDPNRNAYTQFLEVLRTLSNFKCDRTGEEFGPVDSWGPGRALVIDGLTGINKMCLDLVTGGKVIREFREWGVAMDQEMRLIDNLVNLPCTVIVIAHLEPERDEVSGQLFLFASAIGRKAGPLLPQAFGEVIHSYRDGNRFLWSTASDKVSTKSRLLPIREGLPQDYGQIINEWRKRGGELTETL